jgi:cytochrome bd-type quinol oxidase subunit 2
MKMAPVIMFLIILAFWVIPVFFVLRSNKVSGKEKLAWILAITFVSWFAGLFFALLAPIAGSKKRIRGDS